ncbi:MAG TPA: selenium metabolism-associated LysR family transcriptional regulator [Gemmataceae bacterium]|jgi:DNA-binding transcriptional LysR family regulator|nr:selenium metabolism-associated LysR family transcriptional regulator [Gemmataceae bacterium]
MKPDTPEGIQLPHLGTFSKAAEFSSFTAAAKVLGLSQAAVSQRVQALEQTLGVALFHRRGGRVLLTEAGKRLYASAQRILALHQQARQEVTGQKAPLAGDLSLAASSIPGEHLLPEFLSVFRERHPHVRVRVTVTDTQDVLKQVEHGQAHLGLVGATQDSPHLEFRPFACDTMALVVPAGHALARRKQVSLRQLCQQPLIVRERGSGSRGCLEEALAQAGKSLKDLRVSLEMGSNEAIKEAILHGLGLAVLSTHAVQKELRAGRLHTLRVAGLPLERDMSIVWDRRRVLPIPAQLFLQLLQPAARRVSNHKRSL